MKDEYRKSKFVFSGSLIRYEIFSSPDDPSGIDHTVYFLTVTSNYKGVLPAEVKIWDDNTSSRFVFDSGLEYLIFLDDYNKYGFVDSCGNSGPMSKPRADFIFYMLKQRQLP